MLIGWTDALPAWAVHALAASCLALALVQDWRGIVHFRRSGRHVGDPEQSRLVIRGFRALILSAGFASFAAGIWLHDGRWIAFGLIFLFEEIIETGVMLLAMRRR